MKFNGNTYGTMYGQRQSEHLQLFLCVPAPKTEAIDITNNYAMAREVRASLGKHRGLHVFEASGIAFRAWSDRIVDWQTNHSISDWCPLLLSVHLFDAWLSDVFLQLEKRFVTFAGENRTQPSTAAEKNWNILPWKKSWKKRKLSIAKYLREWKGIHSRMILFSFIVSMLSLAFLRAKVSLLVVVS